ncbi:MAG: hypothetical protein HQM06_05810 [Magnetococcales bacterium]|nr:hypothetical protein [Magnetococcales bacterium]
MAAPPLNSPNSMGSRSGFFCRQRKKVAQLATLQAMALLLAQLSASSALPRVMAAICQNRASAAPESGDRDGEEKAAEAAMAQGEGNG